MAKNKTIRARVFIELEVDITDEHCFEYDAEIAGRTAMDGAENACDKKRKSEAKSVTVEWTNKKTYKRR